MLIKMDCLGKENIPPTARAEALQVKRTKQRTVLGVLPENELLSQSLGQSTKHSSILDGSQFTFSSTVSSASCDVFIDEACEVVISASGVEVVSDSSFPNAKSAAQKNQDWRYLLQLSSSPWQDSSDPDDPLTSEELPSVSDYAEDIHINLRKREVKFKPKLGYLEKHAELTSDMRLVVVDWLVEVVQEYKFGSETLYLAVNYLDRFLSGTVNVRRSKLQLVGTVALLVAAKHEEIYPPPLEEFVYITDSAYTKKQLIRAENVLLKVLAFRLATPTPFQFLHQYMCISVVCVNTANLAQYVAELSLLELDPFLKYAASLVAAAAFCLANYTMNKSLWPESLQAFTGYSIGDIMPCLTDLHTLYLRAESHQQQAIRDKYKSSRYCGVSWITPPVVLSP
ncbi:cyclin-A1 [Thalassophryne amazonica]|uniref:cyclin-A1 n=1 Tax=Thalassophryne amazonica TaxID=390379 RepID=UPI001471BD5D|nr:cyclin-A1 [Thalassophryne amazonica]